MQRALIRSILVACAAAPLALPLAAAGAEATAVLKRASAAMGAADLRTIRYAGSGSAASFGQAYKPGMAWPKLNLSGYARVIDYDKAAFREEIARSRAEPTGGGAVPLSGEQRLSQSLSGAHAWNQAGPLPVPALATVSGRIHDLWTTPHGVIKAAMKNHATLVWRAQGGRELAAVSFTEPGVYSATAIINPDYLVERIESRVPNPVLGDMPVVTTYSEYRDFSGVKFPMRIRQTQGGFPVLDLAVSEVQPNAPADIQVPEIVLAAAERVAVEKADEGVWYLAGGSHHSVAIEMNDHLVVVESPLYDGRAAPMLAEARKLAPGKPIRYVVNSHNHFDHAGGLRTAVAEGATIIAQALSKPYYERMFAHPNTISPDRLARSGRKTRVLAVGEKLVLNDGVRAVEIHRMKGSTHTDTFLMVYLPKEKLLIEADAFTPGPPDSPVPPAPLNANSVNLVENIERLKLSVERILPLHGRMVPVGELYRVAGRAR